jgi:hypothetical protein
MTDKLDAAAALEVIHRHREIARLQAYHRNSGYPSTMKSSTSGCSRSRGGT